MLNEHSQKFLQIVIDRGNNMLLRAQGVNMAQYSHGINSTSYNIRYYLKWFSENTNHKSWDSIRDKIDALSTATLKLGGYLFALKENI